MQLSAFCGKKYEIWQESGEDQSKSIESRMHLEFRLGGPQGLRGPNSGGCPSSRIYGQTAEDTEFVFLFEFLPLARPSNLVYPVTHIRHFLQDGGLSKLRYFLGYLIYYKYSAVMHNEDVKNYDKYVRKLKMCSAQNCNN